MSTGSTHGGSALIDWKIGVAAAATAASRPGADDVGDVGDGRGGAPDFLGDEHQLYQCRVVTTHGGGQAHRGHAHIDERGPEPSVVTQWFSGTDYRARGLFEEELAKRIADVLLITVERIVMAPERPR